MNKRVHASRSVVSTATASRVIAPAAPISLKAMRASDVRALQSVAGNRATQRAMQVGAAGDAFEQEADAVAREVMAKGGAQRQAAPEEDEALQAKHAQRQAPEEDELQAKHVQREASEEDEALQAKHVQREASEEDEALQAKHVQREASEEDEALQAKHVQREADDEEALQMKRIQRSEAAPEVGLDGGAASAGTSADIEGARGGGSALPDGVRRDMESHFDADFSGVRVHQGSQSSDLNQRLSARAFTTGSDIFIGREGFNPGSRAGKELLAHELTHVVQQGAARRTARKPRRS